MKTYVVLALAVLSQATGNVFLSKGVRSIASGGETGIGTILGTLVQTAGNPAIWMGTAFLIVFFVLFAAVLSWEDLSFVLPVLSIEVVVNVAFADYFLNEAVSPKRWLGTLLIAVGVVLIGRTRKGHGEEERRREYMPGGVCG
jgi:drug/metabolite transporter (DMT)-like permease